MRKLVTRLLPVLIAFIIGALVHLAVDESVRPDVPPESRGSTTVP